MTIAGDFPILERKVNGKRLVYLDNNATTHKPASVIHSIVSFYENSNSNIHRGVHTLSAEATKLYEEAHEKVARFVGADYDEIVFTKNCTESINLVMYSWAMNNLKEGDEVVLSILEHHSNIVPWQKLQERGIKLRFVDIKDDFILEDFSKYLTDKTKLVCVTHVSNVTGTINPVKEIVFLAHSVGALVLVDGAASVPKMPVNVKDLGCDFLVFSGHKMLGPTGIGVLYARKELLNGMEPFLYGGDMIKEVRKEESKWNDIPWKFEAGTSNIAGAVALGAAVDYLNKIGMDKVREHDKELVERCAARLRGLDFVKVYAPPAGQHSGAVSFNVYLNGKLVHPHDVAQILDSVGIAVRSGHHCAQPLMERLGVPATTRASFYIYNSLEDVDALVEGLKKVKDIFGKKVI